MSKKISDGLTVHKHISGNLILVDRASHFEFVITEEDAPKLRDFLNEQYPMEVEDADERTPND